MSGEAEADLICWCQCGGGDDPKQAKSKRECYHSCAEGKER